MKQWWLSLQASERRTLSVGGVILAIALVYFGMWDPFQSKVTMLEKTVQKNEALSVWMDQSAHQVIRLQGQSGGKNNTIKRSGSLLAQVDQTAKRGGLANALKRVEPDGNDGVRVWLEDASFDEMMSWLLQLEKNNGVIVDTITVDAQSEAGRVNARLSLKGASA